MRVELNQAISLLPTHEQGNIVKGKSPSQDTKPSSNEKQTETLTSTPPSTPIASNNFNFRLKFKTDEATGERVVQIVNDESGKVVRQVPPEELLRVIKILRDLKGLLFSTIS